MGRKCDEVDDDGQRYSPCGWDAEYHDPGQGEDLCDGHFYSRVEGEVKKQLIAAPDNCFPSSSCDWQAAWVIPLAGYDYWQLGYNLTDDQVAFLTVWTCNRCGRSKTKPVRHEPPYDYLAHLDTVDLRTAVKAQLAEYEELWALP